jgi:23S rRNA (cytidine1920-2'-O)/16S rRNA (cytidine1409-2'-O)-methyltransferase
MDWKIQSDPRVASFEGVNARYVKPSELGIPAGESVDLIVVDVSFISLEKIVENLLAFSDDKTHWVTLIKPQFEAGRDRVGKGGIVTDPQVQQDTIENVTRFFESVGLKRQGLMESPIRGTQGNKEFLAHWKKTK